MFDDRLKNLRKAKDALPFKARRPQILFLLMVDELSPK